MRAGTLFLLLISSAAYAQSWQVFDMQGSGLPSNNITAITQDQTGNVWAATDWGLCQWNGVDWIIHQQAEDGLPGNGLQALAVDAQGRLWVGTDLHGIAILENGTWSVMNSGNSPLPDNTINSITHDHRGWAWIATAHGLACITGDDWRIYDHTPSSHMGFELFGPNIRQAVVGADDLVSVVTMNGGLTYITEEAFIYYTTFNSGFPDNSANSIALDNNGHRWIASASAGLIWHPGPFDEPTWFNYTVQNSGLPDNTLTSIVIDQQDLKYVGTETGGVIIHRPDGEWYAWNTMNSGLPDDHVQGLMFDAEGRLWAGTRNGGIGVVEKHTGITSSTTAGVVVVRPTPFQDRLYIDVPDHINGATWTMMDASGRVIATGRSHTGTTAVDMFHVPPGAYHMVIDNNGRRSLVRTMKMP